MEINLSKALVQVFKNCQASMGYRDWDSMPEQFQKQVIDILKTENIPTDEIGDAIELPLLCMNNDEGEVALVSIYFDDEEGDLGLVEGIILFALDEHQNGTLLYKRIDEDISD